MNTSIEKVLEERGKRYGEFVDHAFITQNIKRAMVNSPNWKCLSADMKEALEMIAHKIGRILNGDPNYADSWTDIVGYAKLVERDLFVKLEPVKKVSKYETIPTSQGQQSDKAQSLDPSLRPTKNWQDTVSGYSGQDQRV